METTVDTATLEKEIAAKPASERLSILKGVAERSGVKFDEMPIVQFSDEQLKRILDGDKQKVIEEVTSSVEHRYGMSKSESKSRTEGAAESWRKKKANERRDYEEAAKVFRAIARSATGRARPGELQNAEEAQKEYLVKTGRSEIIRETRTNDMTVGTGSEGGYLSPEVWETMVYDNLARVSLARRFAYWFPMEHNIKRLPKVTANVAAATTTELAAPSAGTRPTIAQATWTLKKVGILTTPFSIELFETADPDMLKLLTYLTTIEMMRKEDEVMFNTSDSGWTDLLDNTTNRVYLGNSSTSGKTDYSLTTFDDMNNLLYKLSEQYIPDEDVQGSGIVGMGEAQFWVNQVLISTLLKLKGTTNQYIWGNVQDLQSGRKIFGKNVRRVLSLPSTTSTGTAFAAFGNLSYKWVGYRDGLLIDLLKEGTVLDSGGGSVSLATTSSYALRINQLMDIQTIDENAFSRLWTANS